jgi:hypothetical protein
MRSRRPLVVTSAATAAAFATLAAGCGGSGSPSGVANLTTSTTTPPASSPQSQQAAAVAYSRCMRSNGVAGFPDPPRASADGHAFKDTVVHIASSDPHFAAAQRACGHLLPNGGISTQNAAQQQAQLADELSFSRCMRRRGVARFPDPTAQGELSVAMVAAQGIDVNSPQVLRIVQACLPASHGGLTPAKVRQALNNFNNGGH